MKTQREARHLPRIVVEYLQSRTMGWDPSMFDRPRRRLTGLVLGQRKMERS